MAFSPTRAQFMQGPPPLVIVRNKLEPVPFSVEIDVTLVDYPVFVQYLRDRIQVQCILLDTKKFWPAKQDFQSFSTECLSSNTVTDGLFGKAMAKTDRVVIRKIWVRWTTSGSGILRETEITAANWPAVVIMIEKKGTEDVIGLDVSI